MKGPSGLMEEPVLNMHPLLTYQTGRIPVHIGLGRLMAAIALCALFWFSIAGDRAKARKDLNRLTEKSYAAGYADHRSRLKEEAGRSDGYLVGMTTAMLIFVLIYEGTAWGIGLGLGYLDNATGERAGTAPPPDDGVMG